MQIFYRVIGPIRSHITIHLAGNNKPRGPGFWKLNTSFLLDSEYIEIIKKTIYEVAMENRNNDDVDVVLLWDTIKMQIRSSSLKYTREKKDKESKKTNSHQFLGVAAAVVSFLNLFPQSSWIAFMKSKGCPQ